MQSSGKMTSSAPRERARSIQAATFAVLPSTSPTVGLIWARAKRTERQISRPGPPSGRPRGSFSLHAKDFAPRKAVGSVTVMRARLSILAAAALLAVFRGAAAAAHPGEPGIRPSRTPWDVGEAADSPDCGAHFCVHWAAIGVDAPSRV